MKLPIENMVRTFPESESTGSRFTIKGGKPRVCVSSLTPGSLSLCGEDEHSEPAQDGDTINCPDCIKIIQLCKKVR